MKTFVSLRLSSLSSVTLTFDLWMSRDTQQIFDVIVHGMDDSFEKSQIHIPMVEYNKTTELALSNVLRLEKEKHELKSKLISCVKDGRSNISVYTNSIKEIVSC